MQSQLRLSDIHSVYPWNGVSDAAIDFYIRSVHVCVCALRKSLLTCREMLPSINPNIACLSALTYTGIVKVMSDRSGNMSERLIKSHQTVNGKMNLNKKSMIIFPCRTRYV